MNKILKSAAGIFLLFWTFSAGALAEKELPLFPPAPAEKKLFLGEKLVYEIYYLGIPVGRAVSEIKEKVFVRGRKAYHLQVKVHSYRVIDFIYKVRDEHHSYVDVETLASLGYEKKLQEGRRRVQEQMELNQEERTARYFDASGNLESEFPLFKNAQDQLSSGYYTRTLDLTEKTSIFMPVHADKRNWNLEVKLHEISPVTIREVGEFQAIRIEPLMEFQGIFIRKGKTEGWISLDARRIPLKMKVKIPVLGNITAELIEYSPGQGK